MTLIVNELLIKGVFSGPAEGKSSRGDKPDDVDQAAMIEACVEAVLKILERRKER